MARSFLAGVIWGTVISGAGLGALSLSTDLPDGAVTSTVDPGAQSRVLPDVPVDPPTPTPTPAPAAQPAPMPAPTETEPTVVATAPVTPPDLSQPGRRPDPETGIERPVPLGEAPVAPPVPAAAGADTALLAPPVVGAAPLAPEAGTAAPPDPQVGVRSDAPVQPGAQRPALGAPIPEAQPVIDTGPAQPPAPSVPQSDSALIADEAGAPDPVVDDPVVDGPVPDSAVPDSTDPAPIDPTAKTAEAAPRPPLEQVPDLEPVLESAEPSRPTFGLPAKSLFDRDPGDPDPEVAAPVVDEADLSKAGPLVRFAADVEVPAGVPRMAVVLIDDGSGPLGPSGLEAFPFPVSFAIAATHPDAAGAAAGYRALGFEVLVLGDMPAGAQASDVEVTMAGLMGAVPEAVAVLENPTGSLQETRKVAAQVAAILAETGHGLVMQPKGLNTAQKLALREGVPAVTLFRDFDGEGQEAGVIRRTLDQAAFRARQEGGVIMMGRLRADTISALVLWGLQDRSGTIALVPVSTVLKESLIEPE